MADDEGEGLERAVGVTSVQAWRGTFAGEPEPDGTPFTFDAVVIEFGIDVGTIPPLFVPVEAVAGLAEVLLEAADGPNATTTLQGIDGDGEGDEEADEDDGEHLADDPVPLGRNEGRAPLAVVPPPEADGVAEQGADDEPAPLGGDEWARLLLQPRLAPPELERAGLPSRPGAYAWFRDDVPVHLGRATGKRGLRARIGSDHLLSDADLSRSPFRRAVAEHLGLVVDVADGRALVGPDGAVAIDAWIGGCTVAWLACATPDIALDLEAALAAEHRPALAPPAG